jgi:hypothetical protein
MKMLRKTSHIILSTLLLFATVGLAISKHYCGGNHVSTSIFGEADSCCDDSDCCKNKSEFFQLDEDYSLVSVSDVPQNTEFELLDLTIFIFNHTKFNLEGIGDFFAVISPPPLKIQTILSQNQTYLL